MWFSVAGGSVIVPVIDLTRATVKGEGLSRAAVNSPASFRVNTKAAGDSDLGVTVTGATIINLIPIIPSSSQSPSASSGADSIWHGGTCPHFYKWLDTGDTVSRKTANKKLTKLYWPSRERLPTRRPVLLEPNTWRGMAKNFSGALCRTCAHTFTFVLAPLWASVKTPPHYCCAQ